MIELRSVSHTYAVERGSFVTETDALVDVDLSVPERQFLAVIGPSGCGKTTLLRVIAGLLRPTTGDVYVEGERVLGPSPTRAVVFQDAGLFPWRTVRQNVGLGLEFSGRLSGAAVRERVDRELEVVHLTQFADQYPHRLSGGMRQRAGLARALAVEPPLLLMDEPFGALDAITRRRLGEELLRVWERDRRTVVFVTHSVDEALLLADRIIVMRGGRIFEALEVGFGRPRHPGDLEQDPEYIGLRHEISEILQ